MTFCNNTPEGFFFFSKLFYFKHLSIAPILSPNNSHTKESADRHNTIDYYILETKSSNHRKPIHKPFAWNAHTDTIDSSLPFIPQSFPF